MEKTKVLFMCVHNSARSQMAEAWLAHLHGDHYEAHSAGLEPGELNPLAVKVMQEVGIDISGKTTRRVFDLYIKDEIYSYVISVCDLANHERCPFFPGITKRLHWDFPDPSAVTGSEEEKLKHVRWIRDGIKDKIEEWYELVINEQL